jgi:hypothetical protein
MKDRSFVLVITPLAIAALFAMIYELRQQGASAREIKLIRQAVEKNLAETHTMHRTLRCTRGAVNQIHQYINPVPKGVKKLPS